MKNIKIIVTMCLIFSISLTSVISSEAINIIDVSPQVVVLPPPEGGATCGLSGYFKYSHSTYSLEYFYYKKDDSDRYTLAWGQLENKALLNIGIDAAVMNGVFSVLSLVTPVAAGINILYAYSVYRTTSFYQNLEYLVNVKNKVNNCGTITILKKYYAGSTVLVGVYSQGT